MSSAWSLSGLTVLITGAARGIGAESARRLAARGANVALVGLEPDELEKVAAEIGQSAAAFEVDVTDRHALGAAVDGTVERFGGIDGVVANAGIGGGGPVRHADPDAFERVLEVNLNGVYRTVHACLPHVVERRGYVLVVASLAAMLHSPGMAPYNMSKAGAEAFGNTLRAEVKHLGVDVGVGYFSWIDTELVRAADRHPVFGARRAKLPGFARKTYPVSAVGDAVVDGFEHRRRMVVVPGWVRALSLLRGLAVPLVERQAMKDAAELDSAFARDVSERGAEASRPVGAGGEAAVAAEARLPTGP
jgi:NAD(P)-dependent dehydrogenase (short-subunit alcohol dehydrogenase family)